MIGLLSDDPLLASVETQHHVRTQKMDVVVGESLDFFVPYPHMAKLINSPLPVFSVAYLTGMVRTGA